MLANDFRCKKFGQEKRGWQLCQSMPFSYDQKVRLDLKSFIPWMCREEWEVFFGRFPKRRNVWPYFSNGVTFCWVQDLMRQTHVLKCNRHILPGIVDERNPYQNENTPPKTNMEPKKWRLQMVFPFPRALFRVPCQFLGVFHGLWTPNIQPTDRCSNTGILPGKQVVLNIHPLYP